MGVEGKEPPDEADQRQSPLLQLQGRDEGPATFVQLLGDSRGRADPGVHGLLYRGDPFWRVVTGAVSCGAGTSRIGRSDTLQEDSQGGVSATWDGLVGLLLWGVVPQLEG